MSLPSRLHRVRRKYSCRGNDMNERESVSMPMKLRETENESQPLNINENRGSISYSGAQIYRTQQNNDSTGNCKAKGVGQRRHRACAHPA